MKLIIGSRDSKLAVIQSELFMAALQKSHPEIELELVTMKTTGDRILDRTLDKIGGKGLFVRELDEALRDGRVDLTVHSCKDLPMEEDASIPLVAFSRRESPLDALVLPEGERNIAAPIGCSSLRRKLQHQAMYPNAAIEPVRGNVQTRLRKLEEGQFSALILASAGLNRLGLYHRIHRLFTPEEMMPAAGQGILAVQARSGFDVSLLDGFADSEGRDCAIAERAFVRTLNGGCSSPVAAYATIDGETITISGMYVDQQERLYKGSITGHRSEGAVLGATLAQELKEKAQ